MLQTILVYSILLLFLLFLTSIASYNERITLSKNKFFRWEIVLIILFFSILFGARYDVGEDHLRYLDGYLDPFIHHNTGQEPIFKLIGDVFKSIGLHPIIYFSVLASIQIFCLLYFMKDEKRIWPFLVLTLIMGQFFLSWMNGIRQDVAACIFLCATTFILRRKFWPYALLIAICIGFHYSALILLPIYFLFFNRNSYVGSRLFQIIILSFVSVIAISKFEILPYFGKIITTFTNLLGYQEYSEGVLMSFADKTKTGLSMYMSILIDYVIVINYRRLKSFYTGNKFNLIYNLYFWGTIMQILFINNLVLARPFRYFRNFKMIIIAYLLFYLFSNLKSEKNIAFFMIMFLLLCGLFGATIVNEPFQFMPLTLK